MMTTVIVILMIITTQSPTLNPPYRHEFELQVSYDSDSDVNAGAVLDSDDDPEFAL